jgi:hypothetical protein
MLCFSESDEIDVVYYGLRTGRRNPYFNMMEINDSGFAGMSKKSRNTYS